MKRRHAIVPCVLLLPVILSSSLLAAGQSGYINQIPDLTQSHISGRQYGYGSEFCAPVAVSNSLMWLADISAEQTELAKLLASARYMNTDVWKGTRTTDVLNGVHAFAMDFFGGYSCLEYQGWKLHPARFSFGESTPDFRWIIEGVGMDSAVWLNVGWYRYDGYSDIYHRVGGHWVTLAGYEAATLIIHDPAPRAGQTFANEYVYVSEIERGMLADNRSGAFMPAKGYLLLGEGMHIKSTADVAILDGAIKFRR